MLTHIYARDFEQMFGLLKQADFNWIWVTWSSGWSLKDENENRENLKKVIARCHANGIHVSAYLQAVPAARIALISADPQNSGVQSWEIRTSPPKPKSGLSRPPGWAQRRGEQTNDASLCYRLIASIIPPRSILFALSYEGGAYAAS